VLFFIFSALEFAGPKRPIAHGLSKTRPAVPGVGGGVAACAEKSAKIQISSAYDCQLLAISASGRGQDPPRGLVVHRSIPSVEAELLSSRAAVGPRQTAASLARSRPEAAAELLALSHRRKHTNYQAVLEEAGVLAP
jgi:hypothetical protein